MAEEEKYCRLGNVRISLERVYGEEGEENHRGFSLCFWIYLHNSTRSCSVILHQKIPNVASEIPFLALSEENKLMLFPLMPLHEEAPLQGSILPLKGTTHLSPTIECPFEKWVHIGCQVTPKYMCLHVNGIMVAGTNLVPLSSEHILKDSLKQMNIVGDIGNVEGYFYNSQILTSPASMKSQYTKDQPVRLAIEDSSVPDGVDLASDGIWNIVGGKPSCRRNFSLEVCLLNASGQPVYKDMEIVAELVYAENNLPVIKRKDDSEEALLISCEGSEFPARDRPLPLVRGRAVFKLKMAQLSSKSDNRLFRVFFRTTRTNHKYPFLEAYSQPIRCISRSKVVSRQTGMVRRIVPAPPLNVETNLLPKLINGHEDNNNNNGKEDRLENQNQNWNQNENQNENRNQNKNWNEKVNENHNCDRNGNQNQNGCEYNSPPWKRLRVEPLKDTNGSLIQVHTTSQEEEKKNNSEETTTKSTPYDSSDSSGTGANTGTVPRFEILTDAMVFRYCLEGNNERASLLREFVVNMTDDDVADFASRVCVYTGCSHHRNQILATKKLIQEGEETWETISRNNNRVLWTYAIPEIVRKFMCIAKSSNRGLSGQDLELLRFISGCRESLGKEDFNKLWHWLYPVALSLSKETVNKLWECIVPRWIEGFITREDSENALRGPARPGTFVLRFPVNRCWPHPDAGNLVISYVGNGFVVRHRLLALDYCEERERDLQSLLMEEPELTQLGRVNRQEMQYS